MSGTLPFESSVNFASLLLTMRITQLLVFLILIFELFTVE